MKKVILASTSLQRKEIMKKSGLPFIVESSGFYEDMTLKLSPEELVAYLSQGKAEAVAKKHTKAIVIGADTIVVIEGKIFGKPYTSEKAKEMLMFLNGKQHIILTGVTIIDTDTRSKEFFIDETKVYFKTMPISAIDAYIETGEPHDKAGAYAIQGLGAEFVEKTEGDFLNAVGLPLYKVLAFLKKEFYSVYMADKVCTHKDQMKTDFPGKDLTVCEDCMKTGDTWVSLRQCLTCGHIGCCNSSKNTHATKHFNETKHPIMKSVTPGEEFTWCYIDEMYL